MHRFERLDLRWRKKLSNHVRGKGNGKMSEITVLRDMCCDSIGDTFAYGLPKALPSFAVKYFKRDIGISSQLPL